MDCIYGTLADSADYLKLKESVVRAATELWEMNTFTRCFKNKVN
jgi:hypothetical protein